MGKGTLILPLGVGGGSGTQGAQGATGMQGATGLQGYTGIQGLDGLQGFAGLQGVSGADGIQGVQGTTGIQGAAGSGSEKIDIATMTPAEQLQLYTDFYTNNAKNYWDYCVGGYNICEIQKMSQYVEWRLTDEDSYVTDGTELAIFIGPDHQFHSGTQWGNVSGDELEDIFYMVYLFSPTNGLIEAATSIYGNVTPDWNESSSDNKAFIKNKPALQTVSLQFTLGDSSVVNYDFYFNPQQ